MSEPALLVLADGTAFEGRWMGAVPEGGVAAGELVFNTVMTGYQEVVTDPSYAGQVLAFTYPHIGNYGVAPADDESRRPFCRGVVVRELAPRPSSWRASEDLGSFLSRHGVPGMTGVDTRRLTRHIRRHGSMPCAFGPLVGPEAVGEAALAAAARAEPGTDGVDLVSGVTTASPYWVCDPPEGPAGGVHAPPGGRAGGSGRRRPRVVAYDFGVKTTMLRHLAAMAEVEVVPAATTASDVLARQPDGVFLSNGPGDPAALPWAADAISELLGRLPLFGICLGHQILATALGARTYKLTFGHHGGNHPVRRVSTGAVEITSQNHNYAVAEDSVRGASVTHVNLNDGVVEGLRVHGAPAFSVQYHPEAGPGPHDARYLFEEFRALIEGH
jgi:carbamoyl-phosphate synthase small subunit